MRLGNESVRRLGSAIAATWHAGADACTDTKANTITSVARVSNVRQFWRERQPELVQLLQKRLHLRKRQSAMHFAGRLVLDALHAVSGRVSAADASADASTDAVSCVCAVRLRLGLWRERLDQMVSLLRQQLRQLA